MKKKLLAAALCAAMVIGLTACGGGAASTPNVGNPAQSGAAQGGENTPDASQPGDSSDTTSVPAKGGPLTDFLGIWVMLHEGEARDFLYVGEDGTWGDVGEDGERDPNGEATCSDGVLFLHVEDESISFRAEGDKLVCEQDSKNALIRMQKFYPAAGFVDQDHVGYWKYDTQEQWIVISGDGMWYTVDGSGARTGGGYIYVGPLSGGFAVLISDDYDQQYMLVDVRGDDGSRMMDTSCGDELYPVDALPDGSAPDVSGPGNIGMMGSFTGLWQVLDSSVDRTAPCVYIEGDGSYITVNRDNEVIASGKVEPTANRQITVNADGSGDVVWTLMEEGTLFDGGDTAMIRLSGNGTPDADTMEDIVGWYAGYDWDKILCVNEDATWAVLDKTGGKLDGGVISVDLYQEYSNLTSVVFIPDSKAYPFIGDQSFNDQYVEYEVERIPAGEIPELMKYVGLWKWDYKDKSVLVKLAVSDYFEDIGLVLEGAEVDADGNVISEFDYDFFRDTEGKLMLEGTGDYGQYHGFRYEMHEDGNGCLCNQQNEKILTPVE